MLRRALSIRSIAACRLAPAPAVLPAAACPVVGPAAFSRRYAHAPAVSTKFSAHDGETITCAPKTIEDLSMHLPPHRYAVASDDYRMPHLTYETSRLEDEAGVILVERKNIIVGGSTASAGGRTTEGEVVSPTGSASAPAVGATASGSGSGSNMTFCNLYKKHRVPADWTDRAARGLVSFARASYDLVTGYAKYNHDLRGVPEPKRGANGAHNADGSTAPLCSSDLWLSRAIFLETVAAVPGMVAGMLRHLRSLRILKKDDGWIHALLEEAENERMHLFFFLKEKKPGLLFRFAIAGAQGVFFFFNFIGYLISPRFMHRFVGYVEEEAVHTYSIILKDIDRGVGKQMADLVMEGEQKGTAVNKKNVPSPLPANHISHWRTKPAPADYIKYYDLQEGATYRDIILCIRADELSHREHNHMYADAHALNAQSHVSRIIHESQPLTVLSAHVRGVTADASLARGDKAAAGAIEAGSSGASAVAGQLGGNNDRAAH